MSQKKRVTMEALRKRLPVIDPEQAEAVWEALENMEPGLVKRINRDDLAALMAEMLLQKTESPEPVAQDCTFRAAFAATWKRWKAGLAEFRRRIAMAGIVLWTGGVS